MQPGKMYKFLVPLVLVSGCMTAHDQKISSISNKSECGFDKGAVFQNTPYYVSKGEEHAPIGGLSRLFGVYDKSIEQVKIQKNGNYLLVRFYDVADKEIIGSKPIGGKGYQSEGGRLIINKWSSCKPGEAGVGCVWSHIELSCTQENDLAVKEIGRGAGMLALVIPIGTSSSYLGLYKRMPDKN
ncbi:hypothetical protein [Paraburkholderia dinghuensis]|uniref:Lipoprotein n=1 Tax=Paraburkholderia dinghuensis TaxID=2305225 RepID=A0A3N6MLG6_9BURK|nr:hypothetical protein [Paraburkholderia dinghuensis]RQH04624.1 hypothetical protein D1Y85_17160 [Paraburkholderia dinghuensis]